MSTTNRFSKRTKLKSFKLVFAHFRIHLENGNNTKCTKYQTKTEDEEKCKRASNQYINRDLLLLLSNKEQDSQRHRQPQEPPLPHSTQINTMCGPDVILLLNLIIGLEFHLGNKAPSRWRVPVLSLSFYWIFRTL